MVCLIQDRLEFVVRLVGICFTRIGLLHTTLDITHGQHKGRVFALGCACVVLHALFEELVLESVLHGDAGIGMQIKEPEDNVLCQIKVLLRT